MTEGEYNEVVDKLSDGVYRYALRCCGIAEYAEDAVQDAFATLWKQRKGVDGIEQARRFLLVVIKRRLQDRWRHDAVDSKYRDESAMFNGEGYDPVASFDLQESLEKAMAMLTLEQRSLLTLHDIEGYDYKEIAEMTGEKYNTVQVTVFRARLKMKEILLKMNIKT